MTVTSQAIQVGSLVIRFYSLTMIAGILLGTQLFSRFGREKGIAPETAWDSLIWFFIGGMIGARLWHVVFPSASSGLSFGYYLRQPWLILAVWNGGLGIPGTIIGGAMGMALFCRRYGFRAAAFFDAAAPGLALGQAVGRLGNYFNQELYGAPSDLPWAITIDPPFRLARYAGVSRYHPLFAYEMILSLINVVVLIWADRKFRNRLNPGDTFALYLILYPVERFVLEFFRLDFVSLGGLNWNQTVMGVTALAAAGYLIVTHFILRSEGLSAAR